MPHSSGRFSITSTLWPKKCVVSRCVFISSSFVVVTLRSLSWHTGSDVIFCFRRFVEIVVDITTLDIRLENLFSIDTPHFIDMSGNTGDLFICRRPALGRYAEEADLQLFFRTYGVQYFHFENVQNIRRQFLKLQSGTHTACSPKSTRPFSSLIGSQSASVDSFGSLGNRYGCDSGHCMGLK